MPHRARPLAGLALALAASSAPAAPPDDPVAAEFFERRVRPVLVEHCLSCHGADGKKGKGGLTLTSRAAAVAGGESGPAVVPGKPADSPLVQAVGYGGDLKMPPKGRLAADEVAALTKWVRDGAVWPAADGADAVVSAAKGPLFTAEQKRFWAFQPVIDPPVPTRPAASPIDAFVLDKRHAAGLSPAPPADPRTLLRRLTFDLTGLPPTPAEADAFLADRSANALAKVVDRLLASTAYGERWGRHWLDVARYADSNGLDENTAFANAWLYRDYVINAFNADVPFDRFVKEQLAGDLLPPSGDAAVDAARLTATGFLVLGPKLLAEPDKQKLVMDIVDEQIDVVSKAFLGLTLSCARCHDHKFDPLPTRDYYGLAGVFRSTTTMATLATVAKAHERSLGGAEGEARMKDHAQKEFALLTRTVEAKRAVGRFAAVGGPGAWAKVVALEKEQKALRAAAPFSPAALAVKDEAKPADVRVHVRGSHLTLGEVAPRVFPRILAGEGQAPVTAGSGRRELADWIASPANPLTARVIVNRVWQHHFGEGLVRTPDNFGRLGERPTHPELLDWLAARFVDDGWSLKKLHRRIVLSEAYRMSSRHDPAAAVADPDNRLLWRFPRRRLEAEAIRDAMLAVAGTLDRTAGGSLLDAGNFEYVGTGGDKARKRYESVRRSVYLPVVRNAVYPFFQAFDFVEPHVSTGKRSDTVVPAQALFMLNNPLVAAQAKAFAASLAGSDEERVGAAYRRAFARPATTEEVAGAIAFVRRYEAAGGSDPWAAWCHVVYSSSEFITLD